jgi:hypothetical protein
LKAHLVADHLAQRRVQLFGNALGYAGCSNTPGLGMSYQFAALTRWVIALATPHGERNFGELRGFAGACFSANNNDLVGSDGCHDFI